MARITIEHANGERDTFSVKGRVAGWVADALADSGCPHHATISIELSGQTYVLEPRQHCNPLWRLQGAALGEATDHTRYSAMVGVA